MQYFHLNWGKEGPGGLRGRGLLCCLSDDLAVTVRCLFFDQNSSLGQGKYNFPAGKFVYELHCLKTEDMVRQTLFMFTCAR